MMKKLVILSGALIAVFATLPMVHGQNVSNYIEQGGARTVIGGSLDVVSGGELDVESGGTLKIAGTAWNTSPTFNTSIKLTPTDTEPAGSEGLAYWDDSENAIKVYNGSAWAAVVTGSPSGGSTLDQAYDEGGAGAGRAVTVDSGAIALTVPDTANNNALYIDANDSTSDPTVLLIENAADAANAITIDIDAQATGRDIEGTGASWHVTGSGVLTVADLQTATATASGSVTAGSLDFANGGQINNDTNGEIEFSEAGEEIALVFTSNTVTWATDTAIDAMAFGDVDALSGINTIAFDAAASSISLAADGAADDLTVSVTGAQDASLVLSSAGTAADALQIISTAGGIDITNGGAATTEDMDISSTNASINISAGEADAAAINIDATAGGIDIDAADDIAITVTSGGAGEDVLIQQVGGNDSSITLSAAGTGTDAIGLQASAGGIDIDAVDDINITVASSAGADDLVIAQTGAFDASILLQAAGTGTDAISLQASAGGIDIDAVADLTINCASAAGADDLVIAQTGAFDASILLQAAGTGTDAISLQASAGGIDIDAVDDLTISVASTTDADDLVIEQTGGNDASVLISSSGTGQDAVGITASAGGISLTASTDINTVSDLDVDAAIVGDGGAAISGMLYTVTNDADGKTVLIAEAQTVQTNAGAVGGGIWNLPEASTAIGMQFTFVAMAAQNLDVNPDDADQILGLTNAAGDAVRNATAGNSLTLIAVDATNWVVVANYGTWSDVN